MVFVATCMPGLADIVAGELASLGINVTGSGKAHVDFSGEAADAVKVCLWSRTAERVLYHLASLDGEPDETPAMLAASQDWSALATPGAPLHLYLEHAPGVKGDSRWSAKQFRHALPELVFSKELDESLCLRVRVEQHQSHLWIDLAGSPLHRRGYRIAGGRAPLRETLAASLLLASQWPQRVAADKCAVLDPFCGSGTLLIEAALIAAGFAAGHLRQAYGFQQWRGCDAAEWRKAMNDAATSGDPSAKVNIKGFDADPNSIRLVQANAERAGVRSLIHVERRELGQLRDRDFVAGGLLVANPPWGERLNQQQEAAWLHYALGKTMASLAPDWDVTLLGSDAAVMDRSGMALQQQWRLRNGPFSNYIRRYSPRSQQPVMPLTVIDETAFALPDTAVPLANRLKKNGKHLRRWLAREQIHCYRLYDRDLPEFNVAVDIYGDQALVQEFKAPKTVDAEKAKLRRDAAVTAVRGMLGVHREQVHLRTRERQKGNQQYRQLDKQWDFRVVQEGQGRFLINLQDYLDTGLFLDHRPMRLHLANVCQGKRFLNLFAYTGAATVHAALGGARRTVTVDASRRYLEWAGYNLAANGFSTDQHQLERADVMPWLDQCQQQFDVVFCDPPTFSNNKSRSDFIVEEHHGELIRRIMKRLEPGGVLYFSCNYRRFVMDESITRWFQVEDITRWSIPEDFRRNEKIHVCYAIRHGE